LENSALTSAWALRGVTLPDRKKLLKDTLPACYAEKYTQFLAELKQHSRSFQIATDGGKKAAERGVPLVNFMVLFPLASRRCGLLFQLPVSLTAQNGSLRSVKQCIKVRNNIQAAMHPDARCTGFVMDNTAANRKAMKLIYIRDPHILPVTMPRSWAYDDLTVERCNICIGIIDLQASVSVSSFASCF
jgi:hypothetical protein